MLFCNNYFCYYQESGIGLLYSTDSNNNGQAQQTQPVIKNATCKIINTLLCWL